MIPRIPSAFLVAAAWIVAGGFVFVPAAHAHDAGAGPAAARAIRGPVPVRLEGVAYEWTVEDRVAGATLRSKAIELDDGTLLALDGPLAGAVVAGTRVAIAGARSADRIEVTEIAALAGGIAKVGRPWIGKGRVLMLHADHFAESRSTTRFEVETTPGVSVALSMPIEAGVLEPGMQVEVEGRASEDGESVVASRVIVHALAPDRHQGAGNKAAVVERVLVIHVKYRNRYGSVPGDPFPSSYARDSMFGSGSSVAGFVSEASYGQLGIAGDVTPWLVPSASAPSGCNHTQLGADARAAATAAGYNLSAYTHQVYVFTGMTCNWSGLSYVGAPHYVWIQGRQNTIVFAHEFGHSLGLLHAGSVDCGSKAIGGSCYVTEYGDPFGAMGTARMMHYNAMQKSKLGWIPASGVKTQTSGTVTHRLAPLEIGATAQYAVRVPAMSGRTYWIEYRQPVGYDAVLASLPNNGVQVRVATPFEYNCSGCTTLSNDTQIVDLTPQSSASDFETAALLVGRRFRDPQGGVVIEVVAANASYADVMVTVEPAPAPDTDSSGTTDLLWWNDATGDLAAWRMNGASALAARTLVRDPSLNVLAAADLDGDGRSDLVVAQGAGGPIAGWTMNGTSISGIVNITSATGWTVAGVGDFDLDGRDDVVLHGAATGTTALWLSGSNSPPVVLQQDAGWRVLVAADFDGDHRADLLWRNESTGALVVWLMNGPGAKAAGSPGTDPNLVLTHVADLNDDGRADLVFRHSVTGQTIAWLMSGTARTGATTVSSDPGWSVAGVGDFDADGHADLVMRHESSGAVAAWLARAGVVVQKTTIYTDRTLPVTHVGDFNGDGKVDIVSRSTSTGKTTLRLMNGAAVVSATVLDQSSSWRVINPQPVVSPSSQSGGSSGASAPVTIVATTTTLASTLDPSTVGASVTFTATVTGVNPTGNVAFKDGANNISGCSGVALTGSGNSRTAQCTTTTLTQGTHSITAVYAGDAGNLTSTSAALSQVVNAAAASTNVALAANGGVASASSTYGSGFAASGTIDGEVAGAGWGNNRGWNDATGGAYPDWLQVNFSGQKTINKVVVYTVQDNYAAPSTPTDSMTFSLYGITGFQVQTWNGSAWVTQATVSGNNLVKRSVTFATVTTDRIRINVTSALASYSRIVEAQAWTAAP